MLRMRGLSVWLELPVAPMEGRDGSTVVVFLGVHGLGLSPSEQNRKISRFFPKARSTVSDRGFLHCGCKEQACTVWT